jgi:hypothetical protein
MIARKLLAEMLVTVFEVLWRSEKQEIDCLSVAPPSSLALARQ